MSNLEKTAAKTYHSSDRWYFHPQVSLCQFVGLEFPLDPAFPGRILKG